MKGLVTPRILRPNLVPALSYCTRLTSIIMSRMMSTPANDLPMVSAEMERAARRQMRDLVKNPDWQGLSVESSFRLDSRPASLRLRERPERRLDRDGHSRKNRVRARFHWEHSRVHRSSRALPSLGRAGRGTGSLIGDRMKSRIVLAAVATLFFCAGPGSAVAKARPKAPQATQALTYHNVVSHFKAAGLRTTEVQKRCTIFFEGEWTNSNVYAYALITWKTRMRTCKSPSTSRMRTR